VRVCHCPEELSRVLRETNGSERSASRRRETWRTGAIFRPREAWRFALGRPAVSRSPGPPPRRGEFNRLGQTTLSTERPASAGGYAHRHGRALGVQPTSAKPRPPSRRSC
jgi:hypothetical protein